MIGLGAMGKSLSLNIQNNGYEVIAFDIDENARKRAEELGIDTANSNAELAESFNGRKAIWLMVPPSIVDNVLEELDPHLQEGDIIIEGGNSHFKNTEERVKWAEERNLQFLGTGVSGGEEGALQGPSIMPGGHKQAYESIQHILEDVAAEANGEPCVTYLGKGGAGHFVKMVHNGIEYGIMQSITEAYHIMQEGLEMSYKEIHQHFSQWAESRLGGYLMEINADIMNTIDEKTGNPIVESILDTAKHKGTGKWTSQTAYDMGVPVHGISSAVLSRILSAYREMRDDASEKFNYEGSAELTYKEVEQALFSSVLMNYAQGFHVLQRAKEEYDYDLNLKDIAAIWRAGCIIRSVQLQPIMEVFSQNPNLQNILLSDQFSKKINESTKGLRKTVSATAQMGIPIPDMSHQLAYYDSLRRGRLPTASLIQAMRDYFGSHTYRRIDEEGDFHTLWTEDKKEITKEDTTEYYQKKAKKHSEK